MESVLDRDLYSEAEAARLLRLAPSTLHWWLEGGERRGRTYRPVLRIEATGSRSVSWAEFIEAGLLRQYRRVHQVPLPQLRRMIDILRGRWGPHPLVHEQPYVGPGRQLLVEAQDEAGVAPEYQLVAVVGGQLLLLPPAESFVEKVEWSHDVPVSWRPHADPSSPVRIDPEVRFGKPAVRGISTEVIWEHVEADESFGEVADQFDLTPDEARWAYAYETSAASGVRLAPVRFYFDADILGLGKLLANLRPDVTYPGDPGGILHKSRRPPCPITTPHTRDLDWIPVVAQARWVAITRDRHIHDHRAELAAVRDHRLRLVALSAPEARTTWEQLEVVMCQWRAIEALVDQEGPLLSVATRTTLRPVPFA